MSTSRSRRFWPVPSCAWHRRLGDRPDLACHVRDVAGVYDTAARTKKGLPLGGIGSGNFMFNLCGSFGPWQMKPGRYEERFLPQAAFHIREQVEGQETVARTLAMEDVLPAWNRLKVGEGDYYALFPRGWCTYDVFDTDISLLFFSPVIKDNYRETSLPVALFLFRVYNPGPARATVSVMFTFPNAPYTGPLNLKLGQDVGEPDERVPAELAQALEEAWGQLARKLEALGRPRQGLRNELAEEPRDGITAVVMRADDPANPPETQGTEWCIAALGPATYLISWDGAGDGDDVWEDFVTDGALGNRDLAPDSEEPSGAVALRVALAPGEEAMLPFALTWHFPQVEFAQGTRWWRRYTEFFPPEPGQSFAMAKEALQRYEAWLNAVEEWTRPIVESPVYPDWLKQGALNELYYTTFGGSFWENGCITKPKRFGARPGQHLHFVMECQEYRWAETFDVRHHISRSYRELWPEIERDILLVYADFIMDTPDGSVPHDAGTPDGDPFFKYDGYVEGYPFVEDTSRTTTPWSEFSPKFIQQVYAYWHKTRDDAFLDEVWPAVARTFRYQQTTDVDGDGITEMKSSEYRDNKLFNAVLWIGALEALIAMAEHRGDEAIAQEARAEMAKARRSAEVQFWNEELGYYQFNAENADIMGDAFIGQRYVDVTGLPPVLDPERMTSHYRQVFRRASLPLPDTDGDGVGNLGVGNALRPDGSPGVGDSEFRHEYEVWTGVSYSLAANLYHWGKRIQDGALQAAALLIGWGVYQQTWLNEATAYWFSTPEAWQIDDPTRCRALMYQRARAIWELLMEVHDPYERRG
ncbi:MAG TPA: hypothetical protein G4O02_12490 [Caldilineae bacterium]|nr:hypothetical protein [Caldilineae bacterium]